MKRHLVLFFLVLLSGICLANPRAYVDSMGEVIEEISMLNLLRGIYLNEEQARTIAGLAQEAEKIRNDSMKEIEALNCTPLLEQLREELFTALAESPPPVREKVVELDNKAHAITGAALDKIARLEDKVKEQLTQGQMKIYMEFVPCIVPEFDLENPVRTGQAAASSRLMPAVELIRNTPEDVWRSHGQAYLDHILKVTEQEVGKMTDEVREDLRRRLVKQAWKIRRMSEADFQIHREKLAKEMLLVNREHTLRSGYRTTGKFARFFLSPAAARILPRWVEIHFDNKQKSELKMPEKKQSEEVSSPVSEKKEAVPGADKSSSALQTDEAGRLFWEEQVPKSIKRLAEVPYLNSFFHAFGKPYAKTKFDEDDKYVDIYHLINEAGVLLTREGDLRFYSQTQGEP